MRPRLPVTTFALTLGLSSGCDSVKSLDDGTGGAGGSSYAGKVVEVGSSVGCNTTRERAVASLRCDLLSETVNFKQGLAISATDDAGEFLISLRFAGWKLGRVTTEYGGTQYPDGRLTSSENRVTFGCIGYPSSFYTPDEPCTIEVVEFKRGTPTTAEVAMGGAGGAPTVEVGSKVTMRVSCPEVLYSPGGGDYGATPHRIEPNEFEISARDCVVRAD